MGRRKPIKADFQAGERLPRTEASLNGDDSTGAMRSLTGVNLKEVRELIDELKEVVTEAHGVLKDLRVERGKAEKVLPMIVSRQIKTEITKQVLDLQGAIATTVTEAEDRILLKFDNLYKQLMGADHTSKKEGRSSIPELVNLAELLESGQITPEDPRVQAIARRVLTRG